MRDAIDSILIMRTIQNVVQQFAGSLLNSEDVQEEDLRKQSPAFCLYSYNMLTHGDKATAEKTVLLADGKKQIYGLG